MEPPTAPTSLPAQLVRLADGFRFTEGPVWMPDGYLLFSDIPANRIYRWTGDATPPLVPAPAEVWREPSGQSNGLTVDADCRLVACEHGNRRVSRTERDGSVVTLADRFEGQRLNSPNDAVVARDGAIYFTDPPYGVKDEDRELDFQGVYRIPPGGGALELLVRDMDRPNGLAFSPDERTLYVADSALGHVRAFDVQADGSLSHGRIFAELQGPGGGVPDGMTVDAAGRLYFTGPGGVWVYDASGTLLGRIETPEVVANCTFGGPRGEILFLTVSTALYGVEPSF